MKLTNRQLRKLLLKIINEAVTPTGETFDVSTSAEVGGARTHKVNHVQLSHSLFESFLQKIRDEGTSEGQSFEGLVASGLIDGEKMTPLNFDPRGEGTLSVDFGGAVPFADLVASGPTAGDKTLYSVKFSKTTPDAMSANDQRIPSHKFATFYQWGDTPKTIGVGQAYLEKNRSVKGVYPGLISGVPSIRLSSAFGFAGLCVRIMTVKPTASSPRIQLNSTGQTEFSGAVNEIIPTGKEKPKDLGFGAATADNIQNFVKSFMLGQADVGPGVWYVFTTKSYDDLLKILDDEKRQPGFTQPGHLEKLVLSALTGATSRGMITRKTRADVVKSLQSNVFHRLPGESDDEFKQRLKGLAGQDSFEDDAGKTARKYFDDPTMKGDDFDKAAAQMRSAYLSALENWVESHQRDLFGDPEFQQEVQILGDHLIIYIKTVTGGSSAQASNRDIAEAAAKASNIAKSLVKRKFKNVIGRIGKLLPEGEVVQVDFGSRRGRPLPGTTSAAIPNELDKNDFNELVSILLNPLGDFDNNKQMMIEYLQELAKQFQILTAETRVPIAAEAHVLEKLLELFNK